MIRPQTEHTPILRIAQPIGAFIAERVALGTPNPVDPAIGARIAIGMFAGLIAPSLRRLEPLPSPEKRRALAKTLVDILPYGVRARTEAIRLRTDNVRACVE